MKGPWPRGPPLGYVPGNDERRGKDSRGAVNGQRKDSRGAVNGQRMDNRGTVYRRRKDNRGQGTGQRGREAKVTVT